MENLLNFSCSLMIQPTRISSGTDRAGAHLWIVHSSMICYDTANLRNPRCSFVVSMPRNALILYGTKVYFINCSIYYPSIIGYFFTSGISRWNVSWDGMVPTVNVSVFWEAHNRVVFCHLLNSIYSSMISYVNYHWVKSASELEISCSTLSPTRRY